MNTSNMVENICTGCITAAVIIVAIASLATIIWGAFL